MRVIGFPRSDAYGQQNLQVEKIAFLKNNDSLKKNTLQSQLQHPISPYQLNAGTIIPANLVTGINSNLSGTITARVRRNVYDTATGNHLLIPQGTTLIGRYDSQVAYAQSQVLIVWSRLLFSDASSFDLQGIPGVDLAGMAGLHDQVDNHLSLLINTNLFNRFHFLN
jgi:type IV secretion system protein TrbI